MKKFLAILVAVAFVMSMGTVDALSAQDQQASPYGQPSYQDQQGPYGAYSQGQQQPPPPGGDYGQQGQLPPPPPGAAPQSQQPSQSPDQQPAAARVSYIHGDVSTQRGDNAQWEALTVNTPVVPGDRVATGNDARAEIQLDYANVLRLSNNATANVATLNRSNIQVQIGQGTVTYSVLRGSEAPSEIQTPNASIHPQGQGDYRIAVNSNEETKLVVLGGSADVSTAQGSTQVNTGQMITVAGTDTPQYRVDAAPGSDEWDSWNADRDRTISNAASWQHTDRYYTGTQDLDQYGTWSEIPDYGPVWTPQADAGWAPYRAGRWVWEPYYGWTWVSYEPWGWAPYHYGRWMVYGGNWCWWPGPIGAYPGYYPIWAPAYVSFYGFGGGGFGFGVGFGFGGGWGRIGWLPVGPGDWFHPWYGRWGGRYNVVGVGAFHDLHEGFGPLGRGRASFSTFNEALRNDRVRGGMSSMGGSEFGRGAVSAHQERISEASFRQGSVVTGRMPVNPTRGSYSATDRAAGGSAIRTGSAGSQHFFSSRNSGSFGASRGASGSFGGSNRGFESNTSRGPEINSSRGGFTSPSRESGASVNQGGNQGGWQHFSPSSREAQPQSSVRGYSSTRNESLRSNSAPSSEYRGGNSGGYSNSSRPALNMRQPIVTPRGESNGGGSYNRSYGGSSAPRGSYSAPRSYSAPQGGSRGYSGGGGGGSVHGGGGGGSSHGGGGGHSGGGGHRHR